MSDERYQLSTNDYLALDATAMADAVKTGELTARMLLSAAQARCDAVNPQINAVNMRHDEHADSVLRARHHAGSEQLGALAGVPMLLKDLNAYLTGTVTTNGSRMLADAPPASMREPLVVTVPVR